MIEEKIWRANSLKTLERYRDIFAQAVPVMQEGNNDILMDLFNINSEMKRAHTQYWGRHLGACWQRLVTDFCAYHAQDIFSPPIRFGRDEPADFFLGSDAIDTKYRIGSGDAGLAKKMRSYAHLLKEEGYRPILLILREDNLTNAINSVNKSGWTVLTGEMTFDYLSNTCGFDIRESIKKLQLAEKEIEKH